MLHDCYTKIIIEQGLKKLLSFQFTTLYLHKIGRLQQNGNNNDAVMQPKLEKIFLNASSSIAVKREITPYMDYPLHYHPEYEIIFVQRSYGIRIMGNHIGNFSDGDLMLIGPNLPHV